MMEFSMGNHISYTVLGAVPKRVQAACDLPLTRQRRHNGENRQRSTLLCRDGEKLLAASAATGCYNNPSRGTENTNMILPAALALGAQLIMPVADGVPVLNVEQVCEGIAQQGGVTFHDPAIAQEKKNCLDSERAVREELVKQWSSFAAADKTSCVNESRMGGESSYTELLTCLEMARDVRAMRNEQQGGASGAKSAR
jgi:hypothetical protein